MLTPDVVNWTKQQLAETPDLTVPQLVDRAIDHFCADGAWVRAWVAESLRGTIQEARRAAINAAARRDRLERQQQPWARWMERDPLTMRRVPLLSLRREQLLDVARMRFDAGAKQLRRAALCRLLADRLDPGQLACDVFTEEDLDRLDRELDTHVAARRVAALAPAFVGEPVPPPVLEQGAAD